MSLHDCVGQVRADQAGGVPQVPIFCPYVVVICSRQYFLFTILVEQSWMRHLPTQGSLFPKALKIVPLRFLCRN